MLSEFREFAVRGSVVDMAVGVVVGGSFGKIVSSLVADVVMPPIGLLVGQVDFSNLILNLSETHYDSLDAARKAGAPTVNVGLFANTVIDFVILAFAIFLVVRTLNRLKAGPAPALASATTRDCPECLSAIPLKARRCAHCTAPVA
jgi:large conductance mechanosensitive channel